MMFSRQLVLSSGFLVVVCLVGLAPAVNIHWDGGGDGVNWGDDANWIGDAEPGSADDVYIGSLGSTTGDYVELDKWVSIQSLSMSNATDLNTASQFLWVQGGAITLNGAIGLVTLYAGDRDPGQDAATTTLDSIDADSISISAGSELRLLDGVVEVDTGLLNIGPGGILAGDGRIDLRRTGAALNLSNDGRISVPGGALLIQNDSAPGSNGTVDLDGTTGAGELSVYGNLTITAPLSDTRFDGAILIGSNGELAISDDWTLGTDATLNFDDNGGSISGGNVTINGTASISLPNFGTGTFAGVDVNISSGTPSFSVNGLSTLQLSNGGTVTYSAAGANFTGAGVLRPGSTNIVDEATQIGAPGTNTLQLDMDAGGWTLNADLSLDVATTETAVDGCDATIAINNGAHFNIDQAGNFKMQSGFVLNGATIDNPGATSGLEFDGHAYIHANSGVNSLLLPVDFLDDTSNITVAPGAELGFQSTTYRGGSFTGGGLFSPGSGAVKAATTFAVDNLDWDTGSWTLDAPLTIDADSIERVVNDGFDGVIHVNGTTLDVNVSTGVFAMEGNFFLDTATVASTIDGNTMTLGDDAEIRAEVGISSFDLPVEYVDNTTRTTIDPGAQLWFNEGATFRGGIFTGNGILRVRHEAVVAKPTIIAVHTVDLDWADEWAINANLTLNVTAIEAGTADGFDGLATVTGSTLAVNTPGTWRLDNRLVLVNSTLTGSPIEITPAANMRGYGSVTASGLDNQGTISADGGTLILDSPGDTMDLDGTANNGVLNAVAGNLDVREGNVTFEGTLNVASGKTLFVGGALTLRDDTGPGLTHLSGGTIESAGDLEFYGELLVDTAPSTLATTSAPDYIRFRSGSNTTINTDLTLQPKYGAYIYPGATMTGTGRVLNTAVDLYLYNGVDLDVAISNESHMSFSPNAAGVANIGQFLQTDTGLLRIEIFGPNSGDSDLLTVDTTATLDGTLQMWRSVASGDPYEPVLGDSWEILQAAGGITGEFDQVLTWPDPLAAGLFWHIEYDTLGNRVVAHVIDGYLDADFNEDGDVDGADRALWEQGYGISSGADHGDGDANGDGAVNGFDFLTWQQQYGESILPVLAASANRAVPEPATWVLLLGAVGRLAWRRKRCEGGAVKEALSRSH